LHGQNPHPTFDPPSEGLLISVPERNITPRTRLILVCHMINLTGQILPVRDAAALARGRGIPVIVDGADALARGVESA
jgi:selenocysteine lyase/cysteine desulfurase